VPVDFEPDFQIVPLLSLPRLLKTTLDSIPGGVPYLRAPGDKVLSWKERFNPSSLNVGVVWAGSPDHEQNKWRSCTVDVFNLLNKISYAKYYSLQVGPFAAKEKDWPGLNDLTSEIKNFADTAAIIANLDLVITVDTSVAHLAGAMGKPVWVLLSAVPDWRWMLDRVDSPWYPSMRLFRQRQLGDWNSVMGELIETLKHHPKEYFVSQTVT
jgi:hypothetical protein